MFDCLSFWDTRPTAAAHIQFELTSHTLLIINKSRPPELCTVRSLQLTYNTNATATILMANL